VTYGHLPGWVGLGLLLWALDSSAQALPLSPCWLKGVAHAARCGVLPRPLDPARPQGPMIDIHVAVLPALARNPKPDAVYFFAGGPGQSAIELAGPASQMLARFANQRDIVLIDQRGTGRSAPLKCDDDDPRQPLAEQADTLRQQQRMQRCREALQRLPHGDLRFYTTPLAMADADAVRAALGHARINLVGGSYGTRAALEYMRQFPQQVRRAVLDGVAPPDMVLPASFAQDNQAALDALLAACEQEAACAQRHPQLRRHWQQLLAVPAREVVVPHPLHGREERFVLDRAGLQQLVRGPLYVPALASALPHAIDEAAAGRFTALAGLGLSLQGASRGLFAGMHFSVICAEDVPRLPAAESAAFADAYRQICAHWPRGDVPAAFYQVPPAPAPVLLLSGGIDPVTPPRHGERVAQALGARARHLVVPHAGHGVLGLACLRETMRRFINADDAAALASVDGPSCAAALPRPPVYVAPTP
jgi:pimeloyl-ACP methyl ester carboxylesterase